MGVELTIVLFVIIGIIQVGVCLSKYCYLGILPVVVYSILFIAKQDESYFIASLIFLVVFFVGVGTRLIIKIIMRRRRAKIETKM